MSSDKSIIFNNLGSQIALTGYLFLNKKQDLFLHILYTYITNSFPIFFLFFSLLTSPSKFMLLHSECLRCTGEKIWFNGRLDSSICNIEINEIKIA